MPGTIENLHHLLDGYGITAHYDLIRKKLIVQGCKWSSIPDNADNVSMTHIVSLACLNGLPRGDIEAYVGAVAEANPIILRTYLGDSKRIQGRDKWRVPFHLNQRGDQVIVPDDLSEYE